MPYVKEELRPDLNPLVYALDNEDLVIGDLAYILYMYGKYSVLPSYNNYKNYTGELDKCAFEIDRRFGLETEFPNYNNILPPVISESRFDSVTVKISIMKDWDLKINGDLNYVLFALTKKYNTQHTARQIAYELRIASFAITKFDLSDYEDEKIRENGDVVWND